MKVWGDPDYLARRYRQLAKDNEKAQKKFAKKERKEARKLMVEQQEKDANPDSKKARKE